jgi:hypothetical protein
MPSIDVVAAVLFALALAHTFSTKFFERLARRVPRHAGLLHLLSEVEVVFGLWAAVLIVAIAILSGGERAVEYAESRHYAEPLFVFAIMVVAASRPVLEAIAALVAWTARRLPLRAELVQVWSCLALVPLLGSLITEPAAMTLAALMLAPLVFRPRHPRAPQVRRARRALRQHFDRRHAHLVRRTAGPDRRVDVELGQRLHAVEHFGWKAAFAVLVNATGAVLMLRKHLVEAQPAVPGSGAARVPPLVTAIHFAFLAAVVLFARHPVVFLGLLLLFLGYTQAYARHQSPLILKEALLVAFFLAGLVVLGGMQQWWLQPIVAGLQPTALFFGALGLTALTDNAALTYLGSLIVGMSDPAKYMLVAGAVAGGGLTGIANAPNPAGVALLSKGFDD